MSHPMEDPTAGGGFLRFSGLIAAIVTISSVGISLSLSLPLLSFILESRGVPASAIGANSAMAGLASVLIVPFVTPLAHRFGTGNLLIAMILVAAVSLISFHFIDSFALWFVLRVFLHGAVTTIFVLSEFWISALAPNARRGLVLGVYATVLSLGFAAGPAILSVTGFTGPLPFLVGFVILVVSALPVVFTRTTSPRVDREPVVASLRFLFTAPIATFAALAFGAAESAMLAFLPVYGLRLGFDADKAALFISVATLGNVVLQIPLGMISDSLDRRYLLLLCALVGIGGAVLMPVLAETPYALFADLFIWGGVTAGLYTIGLAHLGARFSGTDLANANSAFVMMYAAGMLIGPASVGSGMQIWNPHGFAYVSGAFFLAYAVLAVARIARTYRDPSHNS